MAEFNKKQYLDQVGLEALVGQIKAADKVNADAIAAEKTRAESAESALEQSIGKVAQDLANEALTARAAEQANAAAAKKAQDDVDALKGKVGEVADGKTVVGMIEEVSSGNNAAVEAEKERAEAKEKELADAITAEKTRAEGIEGDLNTRLATVEGDYLKAADKTELEDKITAEAERAAAAEKANADAIDALEGRVDTVEGKVTTLIGNDADKSVRTIANEELAAQLLSDKADADFKTLQDLAAWLEDHPESVAEINTNISNLQKLIGTLPEGVTATTIVGYIQEAVAAEKTRAEGVEAGLDERLRTVEAAVGEGGSVATQIDAKIAELDADITSAAVDEGKGVQVQVVETDGKIVNVAVTGNYDNAYDAKGAAEAAQAAAEATAATDATNKANAAESNAKAFATTEATSAYNAVEAIPKDTVTALFAATTA